MLRSLTLAVLLAGQTGCILLEGPLARNDERRARAELMRAMARSLEAAQERGDAAEAERLQGLAMEATRPAPETPSTAQRP